MHDLPLTGEQPKRVTLAVADDFYCLPALIPRILNYTWSIIVLFHLLGRLCLPQIRVRRNVLLITSLSELEQ